ncbi:mCG123925 [Mus musculus]|nr:mCG123925 [Mus musculus]
MWMVAILGQLRMFRILLFKSKVLYKGSYNGPDSKY